MREIIPFIETLTVTAAQDLSFYIKKAAGEFPLTPTTLYWRVYMISETQLKSKNIVHPKHHQNISKYFAILWRYFFEHPNISVENGNFNFPFESRIISTSQLVFVNHCIDNEMRHFMEIKDLDDQQTKVLNIMRMGDIGLKIKKIIMANQTDWTDPDNALNDN